MSVLAAACAAVVVLVFSGAGATPSPALGATLNRLAQIAASGPSLVPGPGQYLYVSSESSYPEFLEGTSHQCIRYAVEHDQNWTAANGSGMSQGTRGRYTYTSTADQTACEQLHLHSSNSAPGPTWFAPGCSELGPTANMAALSTDPQTLLVQMRRLDGGPRTAAEDFVHVGDFLRGTDASPALRAALYRAAALIPGVKLLGTVEDYLGRTGLGVALDAKGVRHELIFNRQTAALMGEEDHGSTPGSDDWAVYLNTRLVNKLPEKSPIALTPSCLAGAGRGHNVPGGGTVITGLKGTNTPSQLGQLGG